MAADHKRIEQLLGDDKDTADNSLRGKSLQRAMSDRVPTTLTPYEWEQWYLEHGIPDSHKAIEQEHQTSWWRRLWPRNGQD